MTDARKLHFKNIIANATTYVGRPGDVWFSEDGTEIRTYDNGTAGGKTLGGGGYNSSQFIDYGDYVGGVDVNIDLTKKYHWLVDLGSGYHYNLLDGVDGQELVFLPCMGLDYGGNEQSDLWINSVKYWKDAGVSSRWEPGSRIFRPFSHANTTDTQAMVKALWINGCWHFDAMLEDLGDVP